MDGNDIGETELHHLTGRKRNKPWKVQFDNGKLPGALAIWPGIDAASLAIMPQDWPSPYSKQCFRIEFL